VFAALVYQCIGAVENITARCKSKLLFQLVCMPYIVAVQQRNPFALRQSKAAVARLRRAQVLWIAE
jgi:hypothetical protein